MKGRQILIEPLADGGHAAALMLDGRLEDVLIDLPDDGTPLPEAIYHGSVARPMKGMVGTMIDLGNGSRGYLRGQKLPAPGSKITVQVSTWPGEGKAPPVTDRIMLKGRTVILTPFAPGINLAKSLRQTERGAELKALTEDMLADHDPKPGLILRSAAEDTDDDEIAGELDALLQDWNQTLERQNAGDALIRPAPGAADQAWRDWHQPGTDLLESNTALSSTGTWEQIAALLDPVVQTGLGTLAIEPTRACVAVDINTGSDLSPAAALKANLAAAAELPRQLRLRGLGGLILIDFAPLAKKDRNRVQSALSKAFRNDGTETTVVGWTPAGNLELQRKRAKWPLKLHAGQISRL